MIIFYLFFLNFISHIILICKYSVEALPLRSFLFQATCYYRNHFVYCFRLVSARTGRCSLWKPVKLLSRAKRLTQIWSTRGSTSIMPVAREIFTRNIFTSFPTNSITDSKLTIGFSIDLIRGVLFSKSNKLGYNFV